jgi:hypothetical protein
LLRPLISECFDPPRRIVGDPILRVSLCRALVHLGALFSMLSKDELATAVARVGISPDAVGASFTDIGHTGHSDEPARLRQEDHREHHDEQDGHAGMCEGAGAL